MGLGGALDVWLGFMLSLGSAFFWFVWDHLYK